MHKFYGSNPVEWVSKMEQNFPSMIYGRMKPKYMWDFYTYIKNNENGGNGIRNAIWDYQIRPCSPK